jgi:hypothetical protein
MKVKTHVKAGITVNITGITQTNTVTVNQSNTINITFSGTFNENPPPA